MLVVELWGWVAIEEAGLVGSSEGSLITESECPTRFDAFALPTSQCNMPPAPAHNPVIPQAQCLIGAFTQ